MTGMQCVWTCVYSVLSHSLILSSLPCVCVHNVVVCVECGLHGMYICSIYSVCVCTVDNLLLLLPNESPMLTLLYSPFFSGPQFVSSMQEICLTENRRGLNSWHKLRLVIQERSVWKDGHGWQLGSHKVPHLSLLQCTQTQLLGLKLGRGTQYQFFHQGRTRPRARGRMPWGKEKSASLRALLPQNSAESCHLLYKTTGTVNPSICREVLGEHGDESGTGQVVYSNLKQCTSDSI